MSERILTPVPLRETEPAGSLRGLARLVRQVDRGGSPFIDDMAVARIDHRLRLSLAMHNRASRRWRVTPAMAAAVVLIFAGAVIASAATLTRSSLWRRVFHEGVTVPKVQPESRSSRPSHRYLRAASIPVSIQAPVTPSTNEGAVRPSRKVTRTVAVLPAPAAAPAAEPRSPEVALFAETVARVRSGSDIIAAMQACDEYLARFPSGAFGDEVRALKAEVAITGGRRAQALAILDRLRLSGDERGLALRLARAEMRAASACGVALADFDHVLAAAPPAPLIERALYGRSACRAQLGDSAGAAQDARRYLDRFPDGSYAALLRGHTGL